MNEHVWWYVARATGIVAWGLATLSVLWGLALSTRALGPKPKAPWLLDLHRYLGGLCVLFVLAHMGALVADSYVDFGPADLLVPGAASWKPVPVAWGVVAFYLLLAVEVSSLAMSRLPKRVWKAVHFTSYAVYVLATVHFLVAGTDAANQVVRVAAIASAGAVAFFTLYRAIGPGRAASARRAEQLAPAEPGAAAPGRRRAERDATPLTAAPGSPTAAERSARLAALRERQAAAATSS